MKYQFFNINILFLIILFSFSCRSDKYLLENINKVQFEYLDSTYLEKYIIERCIINDKDTIYLFIEKNKNNGNIIQIDKVKEPMNILKIRNYNTNVYNDGKLIYSIGKPVYVLKYY